MWGVPSSAWELLKGPYQNSLCRIAVEVLLLGLVLRYAFSGKYRKSRAADIVLTSEGVAQAISEWEPKELGESLEERSRDEPDTVPRYILSSFAPFVFNRQPGQLESVHTHLPLEQEEDRARKKQEIKNVIQEYGVGTCGPRGFYGTLDLQIHLEKELAATLGVEEVVLYAHGLTAIASVIKCFCKRSDVIFYDHRSSNGIRRGILASRALAVPYTSPVDLHSKMSLKKPGRAFVITEGVFEETGEAADILSIIRVKKRHKAFLILDESVSIPLLGSRGCVGFFRVPPKEIDIWLGSLALGYESSGGFCGGTKHISDYQRLSSLAYCFSASLPGFLARFASMNVESVKKWESELAATGNGFSPYETDDDAGSSHEESDDGNRKMDDECNSLSLSEKSAAQGFDSCSNTSRASLSPGPPGGQRNSLVNLEAAEEFARVFNKTAEARDVSFRARANYHTPIALLRSKEAYNEEQDRTAKELQSRLKQKGIFLRASSFPSPALLAFFNNTVTNEQASDIATEIVQVLGIMESQRSESEEDKSSAQK